MPRNTYSYQQVVIEVENRLNVLHNVKTGFIIGKNKLIFNVNNVDIYFRKDKEKTTGSIKSIVECLDMFPCVLYPSESWKFKETDVEQLTIAIDKYFTNECLGLEEKAAICNSYHYAKDGLLPFFKNYSEEDAQETILSYMITEATQSNSMNSSLKDKDSIVFLFQGTSCIDSNDKKIFIVDVENYGMNIIPISNFKNSLKTICAESYKEEDIHNYFIEYADTFSVQAAVSRIISGYENFVIYTGKIIPEDTENIERQVNWGC